MTKGRIPPNTMKLMLAHADKVKAQIGVITPYDEVRRIFEPNAADIETRLGHMREMIAGGIAVEARLMPVIPGITDKQDSLERLFDAIRQAGITKAAVSTLFLRPAIAESMRRHAPAALTAQTLYSYRNENRIAVHAGNSSVVPLPRLKREEIYANVRQIAKIYDIEISICGCMNPDIGGTCNISGKKLVQHAQLNLFE